MTNKNNFIKSIIIILATLSIFIVALNPYMEVSANLDEANRKLNEELSDYTKDNEEITDFLDKFKKDLDKNKNPSRNTILHVLNRTFGLGVYINDVSQGTLAKDLKVKKSDVAPNGNACNPNAPNNLINHNCNIPNFTTSLLQNIISIGYSPFINASKTSSLATFGLGVPNNIPEGEVPLNPNNRKHTYTALETFGYNLKLTSYTGEWDNIKVSTEARMLSNFGFIDKITLVGNSLWDSTKAGIGSLIENFSFNPFRWASMISKSFEEAASSGINTVIDTQDLNIVATNGWKREQLNNSLYNIYVMTDKEVLSEISMKYFNIYNQVFMSKAEENAELNKVLSLKQIPEFTFIEDWETEESETARQAAESHNVSERNLADSEPGYSPNYVSVPDPVYYTEKDQLGFWAEENAGTLGEAANEGLISGQPDDYESYSELVAQWNESWGAYFSREFDASNFTVKDILDKVDTEVLVNNPHLDPKQGISHYACANDDGSIMRNSNGDIEYLYLKNNKGSSQYLNPKCKQVRSPLNAGFFGNGWKIDRPIDTRHVSYVSQDDFGLSPAFLKASTSIGRSLSSFIAKVTNVIIGFSFSPILDELGISEIIGKLMTSFRDTIFFPMAALASVIGAIMLFIQVLKNGSLFQFFISMFLTLIIFIAGALFLLKPEATINLIEKVPTSIDNFIANVVLSDDDGTDYCSTGNTKDGIRSAQCNVWGAMVFNPWVHLQFGTDYDNLYANGYAPENGQSLQNTNEGLVGNAEVNMGGGKKINNWALYQLSLTKSGTITNKDDSSSAKLSNVDKNMYRLADLQAGPNNGAGTDSRYFGHWSGSKGPNEFLSLLMVIQSIFMSIVLISLGLTKIEVSLMFSISILLLPFILLYSFFPQGKGKLRSYLSNLASLIMKRVVVVMLFAILLKIYSVSYSTSASLEQNAIFIIVISTAMMIYKKEIINLITSSEGGIYNSIGELSNKINQSMPKAVKQKMYVTKRKVTGSIGGGLGGAMGYASARSSLSKDRRDLSRKLNELNKQSKERNLDENELELKNQLEKEINQYEKFLDKKDEEKDLEETSKVELSNDSNFLKSSKLITKELSSKRKKFTNIGSEMFSHGVKSARRSGGLIGAKAERKMRREGFAINKVYKDAEDNVINKGADSITNKDESIVLDTYRELISHSKSNVSKTSNRNLTMEEGRLLRDPKVQKELRRLADERKEKIESDSNNKDRNSILIDKDELEKIASILDKKRKSQKLKGTITSPVAEKIYTKETETKKIKKEVSSQVKNDIQRIIKEEEMKENEKGDEQ